MYGTSQARMELTADRRRAYFGHGSGGHELEFMPDGRVYPWELRYNPAAQNGAGALTMTLQDRSVTLNLTPEHRAEGARMDCFGVLNTFGANGKYAEVYWDDLSYTSRKAAQP